MGNQKSLFTDEALEKLRARGVICKNEHGEEVITLGLQSNKALGDRHTRESWKSELDEWSDETEEKLKPLGIVLISGTLSYTGQTVEVAVPVSSIGRLERYVSETGDSLHMISMENILMHDGN